MAGTRISGWGSALPEKIVTNADLDAPHETQSLSLDCSKARLRLRWRPRLEFAEAVALTAGWYSAWSNGEDMLRITRGQIATYLRLPANRLREANPRE